MANSTLVDSFDAPPCPNLRLTGMNGSRNPAATRAELEGLYRTHFVKICGYFRRCGEPEAVAHELAQDTFIQALRGLTQFDGRALLSTWLWTIARNTWLGHLRKKSARGEAVAHPGEDGFDPDTLTAAPAPRLTDQCDCVRRGFARFSALHPERAQAIYLSIVEGWTCEELAASLGRTTHATTEYLSQCRAKLRPFIADCDDKS